MGEIRKTTPQSMNEKLTAADCCRYTVGVELGFQGRDTSGTAKKEPRRKTPEGLALPPHYQGGKDPGKLSLSRANSPDSPSFTTRIDY